LSHLSRIKAILFLIKVLKINTLEQNFVQLISAWHLTENDIKMSEKTYLRTAWRLVRMPFWVCVGFVIVFTIFGTSLKYSNLWADFTMHENVEHFFCEAPKMENAVRQPINTWTNLPFLFMGLLLIRKAREDSQNKNRYNLMLSFPIYTYIYGFSCLYLFLGSTFFHASLVASAQQIDMSGVYALALFPIFYNLNKIYNINYFKITKKTTKRAVKGFISLFLICLIVFSLLKWRLDTFIVIPSMLLMILLTSLYLEYRVPNSTNKTLILVSTLAIAIGIGFYALDVKKVFCNSNSLFQPHAIWHLFAATATFACYLYLRSENKTPQQRPLFLWRKK